MRLLLSFALLTVTVGCGDAISRRGAESNNGSSPLEQKSAGGAHDDPTVEFRRSCAPLLETLPLQHEIAPETNVTDVVVETHASGAEDCADFSWLGAAVSVAGVVEVGWAGPARSSAWDCNHSSIEYGVYRSDSGRWEYVDGALAFGALSDDGSCIYSVDNFPEQPGSDAALVVGSDAEGQSRTKLRVGVRSWSHNDPAFGHGGADCGATSCYWPTHVSFRGY